MHLVALTQSLLGTLRWGLRGGVEAPVSSEDEIASSHASKHGRLMSNNFCQLVKKYNAKYGGDRSESKQCNPTDQ